MLQPTENGKNTNVSNGHEFLEVAHTNVSPRILSFKQCNRSSNCFLDCA